MEKIAELCQYIYHSSDNTFRETELRASLATLYKTLKQLDIIQLDSPVMLAECVDCDEGHFTVVHLVRDRFMTQCDISDSATIREVDKSEITRYSFNVKNFSEWLAKGLSLSEDSKRVGNNILFLGKRSKKSLYLLIELDYEKALNAVSKINDDNKCVIWLGETLKIGFSPYKLIDLSEILKISNNDLSVVSNLHFLKDKPKIRIVGKNGLALDRHIVIAEDRRMLMVFNPPTYEYEEKLTPQIFNIIKYFYDQRKYGVGYTSVDIAHKLSFKDSHTASTRIGELNAFCKRCKVKELLIKAPEYKWLLNPQLDCINLTETLTN